MCGVAALVSPTWAGHGNELWWVGRYSSSVVWSGRAGAWGPREPARRHRLPCVTGSGNNPGVVSRPAPQDGKDGEGLLTRRVVAGPLQCGGRGNGGLLGGVDR